MNRSQKQKDYKNKKILQHQQILMQLNKLWEINLIITPERHKLLIILLETKWFLLNLPLLIQLGEILLNGKFLTHIWNFLKQKKMKDKIKKNKKKLKIKKLNHLFIQIHLKDVLKLWKEWLFKMISMINMMITDIIGLKKIKILK